jgi:iron complex transport system ATP-binding protein
MSNSFLNIQDISFSYGVTPVLQHISFQVEPGSYTSLIGTNGSGKTTLFNIISGYYAPAQGRVCFCGREIRRIPILKRAAAIALVTQRQSMNFPYTVLETVLMGMHPHRARFEPVSQAHLLDAKDIMKKTDVWQFADKTITTLSGGELQRVILARALMQRPRLLLLDEAMSELDIAARIAMMKLLRQTMGETGMAVIGIHHDLSVAYRYSDRVIALQNGCIAADGDPADVFTKDFFREVFFVDAEILPGKGFIISDNI